MCILLFFILVGHNNCIPVITETTGALFNNFLSKIEDSFGELKHFFLPPVTKLVYHRDTICIRSPSEYIH